MLNPYAAIRPTCRANFLMLDRGTDEERLEWREGKCEWGERDHISSLLIGPADDDARAAPPLGPLPRDAKAESTGLDRGYAHSRAKGDSASVKMFVRQLYS